MNKNIVIKIENLGKRYLLMHQRREDLLYNVLANKLKNFCGKIMHPFKARPMASNIEEFWALKNLSFDVELGERVGVIGRNGAGKSTLLKVLSRITEPTQGRISLKGRVASLLEVGTGFHPELTGRENISLNAAILGMTHAEIKKNFDAIVDFAGVEKFLDTPVKRYSSGMYVRLAFAIAAHLNSEILIVDEVLAVGDVEFQKKCMGKMDEVSHQQGRTILFVSHNMSAISQLCNRVICMEHGQLTLDTKDVTAGIKLYMNTNHEAKAFAEWLNDANNIKFKNPYFTPRRFGLYYADKQPVQKSITRSDKVYVEIEGDIETPDSALCVGFALYTQDGLELFRSFQTDLLNSAGELKILDKHVTLRAALPVNYLNLGDYRLMLIAALHNRQWLINIDNNTPSADFTLDGLINNSPYCLDRRPGFMAVNLDWQLI